jgi:hypothetical protein
MASDPQLLQIIKRGRAVSRGPLTGVICSDKRSLGGGVCGEAVMTFFFVGFLQKNQTNR